MQPTTSLTVLVTACIQDAFNEAISQASWLTVGSIRSAMATALLPENVKKAVDDLKVRAAQNGIRFIANDGNPVQDI